MLWYNLKSDYKNLGATSDTCVNGVLSESNYCVPDKHYQWQTSIRFIGFCILKFTETIIVFRTKVIHKM